jgi:hypothetical protein
MRILLTLLLFGACCFSVRQARAQSFAKNTMLLEVKPGLGIYTTTYSDQVNGKKPNGGAALFIFPLTFEYGVTNWLGVGGLIESSHYIQNKDSVAAGKGISGGSFDIGPIANAHFLRTPHTDLYAGVKLLFSGVKITSNDGSPIYLQSGGTVINFCFGSRFIIGNHFALSLELGYSQYSYPNGMIEGDPLIDPNGFALYLDGVSLSFGVGYKF